MTTTIINRYHHYHPTWGNGYCDGRKTVACQHPRVLTLLSNPHPSHWVLQAPNPAIRPTASLSGWCQKAPGYTFKEEKKEKFLPRYCSPLPGRWYCLNEIQPPGRHPPAHSPPPQAPPWKTPGSIGSGVAGPVCGRWQRGSGCIHKTH